MALPVLVKGKKEGTYTLKGVQLLYVKNMGYGALKFGKEASSVPDDQPWMEHQWELRVVVDKATLKELKKIHKKTTPKEYDEEEFMEAFGIQPLFESDEYFTVIFYKEAFYPNGEEGRAPLFKSQTREDLKEVGIGNGSVGDVVFYIKEFDNKFGKGTSCRLSGLMVRDLVPYESSSAEDEMEFDDSDEAFAADADANAQADSDSDDWE